MRNRYVPFAMNGKVGIRSLLEKELEYFERYVAWSELEY